MSCESELLLLQTQMSEGRCMYASPLIALPSGACCERFLPPAPQGTQCSCCRHSSLPHPACQVCPWVCMPKSCGRPDSSLIVVVVTRPVCCVCSVCLCESSCQRRSAGSFLSCQLSPKLCHTHAAALATTPSMLPLLPCPAALQTMPASLLFDLECHAKICLVTLALLFLAKKACA